MPRTTVTVVPRRPLVSRERRTIPSLPAADRLEQLDRRHHRDAVLREPRSQVCVREEVGVARDDHLRRSGERGGDDRRVVGVADGHVELGRRESRRQQSKHVLDVLRLDFVAPQSRPAEPVGEFLGDVPRGDELESMLA
jgi:hypothetical protein